MRVITPWRKEWAIAADGPRGNTCSDLLEGAKVVTGDAQISDDGPDGARGQVFGAPVTKTLPEQRVREVRDARQRQLPIQGALVQSSGDAV